MQHPAFDRCENKSAPRIGMMWCNLFGQQLCPDGFTCVPSRWQYSDGSKPTLDEIASIETDTFNALSLQAPALCQIKQVTLFAVHGCALLLMAFIFAVSCSSKSRTTLSAARACAVRSFS